MLGRALTAHIANGTRADVSNIYRDFVRQMQPAPVYLGLENLPANPRFLLAANHYQREGLWIAHAASAIAGALLERYGAGPPVRWVVTANWPRWRIVGRSIPSPGDWILPRVAHALWCYAVPFAGSNPAAAAASLRRLVNESERFEGPVGIFPEGAQATAGEPGPALPGAGRFLALMARRDWPVLPVGVGEDGRFVIRFGCLMPPAEIAAAADPGEAVMDRIRALCFVAHDFSRAGAGLKTGPKPG